MSLKSSGIIFSIFACFLFLSCGNNSNGKNDSLNTHVPNDAAIKGVQTVTINNEYVMEIPKHMTATTELNNDASLQYVDTSNNDNEEYVIVIDESKADFMKNIVNDTAFRKFYEKDASVVKNYSNVEMAIIKDMATLKSVSPMKSVMINGLNAMVVDIVGQPRTVDNEIYYRVAFIEGPTNLYMVMAWTLAETKSKYDPEMGAMLNSFRMVK